MTQPAENPHSPSAYDQPEQALATALRGVSAGTSETDSAYRLRRRRARLRRHTHPEPRSKMIDGRLVFYL